jgi:hypothetical protein
MANLPSTPSAPPPWPVAGAPRRPRRWPTVAWLVAITLVAGVATIGWLRPLQDHKPSAAPTYTDQQVATAKMTLCTAFGNVDHALDLADARSTGNGDPTAQLAVATSTRQVLDAGSRYLLAKLAEQPATPPELATAIRQQANAYQDVVIGYLDGLNYSDPVLKSAGKASNEATDTIRRLCK